MCAAGACIAAATAVSALPLGLEVYLEHFRGSFADKWMWTPVALSPALSPISSPDCAPPRATIADCLG